jgi:hypothetical protein
MLITPEDLDRLARLEIEREGDHDVVWACRLARKLAWLKPTEAEFPQYVGLVNHLNCSGYIMRHDETLLLKSVVGSVNPRFRHLFICDKVDAFLCVRPYVSLDAPKSPEILYLLETHANWRITIDEKTLAEGWLAEILAGFDGYGIRRKPYVLRAPQNPIQYAFAAGAVEACRNFESTGYNIVPSVVTSPMGVFLSNEAKLDFSLTLPRLISEDPTVRLSMGLVAARYTTKEK